MWLWVIKMHVKVVKKKLDRNNSFNIRQELLVVSWTIVLKYWSNKKCPKYEGCFCLINPSRLLSTPAVPTTTHLYSSETMMPQESATDTSSSLWMVQVWLTYAATGNTRSYIGHIFVVSKMLWLLHSLFSGALTHYSLSSPAQIPLPQPEFSVIIEPRTRVKIQKGVKLLQQTVAWCCKWHLFLYVYHIKKQFVACLIWHQTFGCRHFEIVQVEVGLIKIIVQYASWKILLR